MIYAILYKRYMIWYAAAFWYIMIYAIIAVCPRCHANEIYIIIRYIKIREWASFPFSFYDMILFLILYYDIIFIIDAFFLDIIIYKIWYDEHIIDDTPRLSRHISYIRFSFAAFIFISWYYRRFSLHGAAIRAYIWPFLFRLYKT